MSERKYHEVEPMRGPPIPNAEELSGEWMDAYGWGCMMRTVPAISVRKEFDVANVTVRHLTGPDGTDYVMEIRFAFKSLKDAKAFAERSFG